MLRAVNTGIVNVCAGSSRACIQLILSLVVCRSPRIRGEIATHERFNGSMNKPTLFVKLVIMVRKLVYKVEDGG